MEQNIIQDESRVFYGSMEQQLRYTQTECEHLQQLLECERKHAADQRERIKELKEYINVLKERIRELENKLGGYILE